MSSLRMAEKAHFEALFGMGGGYVLDFSNNTFAAFFRESARADIYSEKYARNGNSKANRLRSFLEVEPDQVAGHVLAELLEYWRAKCPRPSADDVAHAQACGPIMDRLLGRSYRPEDTEDRFLQQSFADVALAAACSDAALAPILEARYAEAEKCLKNDAPLSAIFQCGSILEGLLLGAACANPQKFNQAPNSPRDDNGKVKQFQHWKLAEFIDVACELGFLKLDVKKFGHALRDFRNYIHPYQQMASGFNPDKHTARICLQVLRAAIASLGGQRS